MISATLTQPLQQLIANVLLQVVLASLLALVLTKAVFKRAPAWRYGACLCSLIFCATGPIVVSLEKASGLGLIRLHIPGAERSCPTFAQGNTFNGGQSHQESVLLNDTLMLGVGIWSLGALWGLTSLTIGLKRVREIRARSGESLKLSSSDVRVFLSKDLQAPMATGIFAPAVILPESLVGHITPLQLKQILLHESAHLKFRHTSWALAARIVSAIYWPIPLVHAVRQEMAQAQEEVCDNFAAQATGAACYARTLLDLQQEISFAPHYNSALALLGPENSLESRISGLLDPRRNRMVKVDKWQGVTLAVASLVLVAGVQLVLAAPTKSKIATKAGDAAKYQAERMYSQKVAAEQAAHGMRPNAQMPKRGQTKLQAEGLEGSGRP